jgi:hypothetical protein
VGVVRRARRAGPGSAVPAAPAAVGVHVRLPAVEVEVQFHRIGCVPPRPPPLAHGRVGLVIHAEVLLLAQRVAHPGHPPGAGLLLGVVVVAVAGPPALGIFHIIHHPDGHVRPVGRHRRPRPRVRRAGPPGKRGSEAIMHTSGPQYLKMASDPFSAPCHSLLTPFPLRLRVQRGTFRCIV